MYQSGGGIVSEIVAQEQNMDSDQDMQKLKFILDIPLQLTVELGRTNLLVKDVLQLNQGAVVELSKLAGEPLDVFINSKLVARGEAVVVNEKFGVRLVDVISPNERVEKVL
jgi:flagellar motor switch protein FliN/FliY